MKPKTRLQKAVFALSKQLPSISNSQRRWAEDKTLSHFAFRLKSGQTTCMDCGAKWQDTTDETSHVCPHCGKRVAVKDTQKRTLSSLAYFSIITTIKGFQVVRTFLIRADYHKGEQAKYELFEVAQWWTNEQGKEVFIARLRLSFSHIYDSWRLDTPLEIRKRNIVYEHITYGEVYPRIKVLPLFKRNGFKGDFLQTSPILFLRSLFDNRMETLLKVGRTHLFRHFLVSHHKIDRYWTAIRIAIRRNYNITEVSIWTDYINDLIYLGKDLHYPQFVCPPNVREAHQKSMKAVRNKREKEYNLRQRKESQRKQAKFYKDKQRFFALTFTDGKIKVKVLDSIDA